MALNLNPIVPAPGNARVQPAPLPHTPYPHDNSPTTSRPTSQQSAKKAFEPINFNGDVSPSMSSRNSCQSERDVSPSHTGRGSANMNPNHSSPRSGAYNAKVLPPVPHVPMYIRISRHLVHHKGFTLLTTILTIYALIGVNLRLIFSEQPVDPAFDWITGVTMLVFVLEIVLSSLGKEDYFLSFFFNLDVVSTLSLLLDMTFIPSIEELFEGDSGGSSSNAARIGGRAGRVSRVIRLVRIVKLYKHAAETWAAQRVNRKGEPGDEDNWDDIEVNEDSQVKNVSSESQVGKRLSELTIRRVISLVLLMLCVQPILQEQESNQFDSSMVYGADAVSKAFRQLVNEGPQDASLRETYETSLLTYLYYHNWFSAKDETCYEHGGGVGLQCSRQFPQQLFYVGVTGEAPEIDLERVASIATVSRTSADAFALLATNQRQRYQFGTIPSSAQDVIYSPWSEKCAKRVRGFGTKEGETLRGISLLQKEGGDVTYAVKCPADIRPAEQSVYYSQRVGQTKIDAWRLEFYFDKRSDTKEEAKFQLYLLIFICCMLLGASLQFTADANALVLHPVESMISKVNALRSNPLMAMKIADEEFKVEEKNKAKAKMKQDRFTTLTQFLTCKSAKPAHEPMETVVLEKTIIKLGSLLALGFGEAGASIIEHNMHGVDSACVDAMVDGTKVECIIGTSRIRDFSIATEVLQAKIMTFVNQIAEIVHGVVTEFHGAANKNNGDTFLLIWRTSEYPSDVRSKLADMAMVAFARMLASVHRSPVLAEYRGHPGLQQRLGKNCRVNMGSAVHYGWAIEGAVGSEFKIDASYLSPNVSLAESMERATQIYNVSVLVADAVLEICTPSMAAKCRLIDRVKIAGSVNPMELFVVDMDHFAVKVEQPLPDSVTWNSRQRFKARQCLEAEKAVMWGSSVKMVNYFNDHADIAAMRFRYTVEFMNVFNMGYQNYSQGEWMVAQRLLRRTQTMLRVEDGPSLALLRFMEVYQFHAPAWWRGVRPLAL